MAPSTEFLALCADPYAEPLRPRLYVRLNDDAGMPGTLVELTASQEILELNPIERSREWKFGVVQAQAWQAQITNIDQALLGVSLKDCWAVLRGVFEQADEWEHYAQGKIRRCQVSAKGIVVLEVHDAVMDVINGALPRTIRFQLYGWISPMEIEAKASGSKSWDPTVALVLNTPASADDETFVIEFTTPTNYKVILENGNEAQTGTIGTNKTINNVAGDSNIITIPAAGWDTASGAYATGDRFVFYTSRPRTPDELTPIYMVEHLLIDILGLEVFDVMTGANYSTPLYDDDYWSTQAEAAVSAGNVIMGTYDKGTSIAGLVQDALKIVHGTIYPTETGQIGLWVPVPSSSSAVVLNGNAGQGSIDILENATYEDISDDAIRSVTFNYRTLDGEEASYTATDPDALPMTTKHEVVDISWECVGTRIKDSADRYLMRFRAGIREYVAPTTLAGFAAKIGGSIAISEGELGLDRQIADVTFVSHDLVANSAVAKAHVDRYVNANIFILDQSLLDGPEVLK